MKRENVLLSFLGFCILSACGSSSSKRPAQIERTESLIWIVCEDQSLFFAQYGDSTAHTPHLNSLADDGTVFDHMFSVAPVCAPSRSSILTGVLPTSMGSHHMRAYKGNGKGINQQTGLPLYSAKAPPQIRAFTEHLRLRGVYCTNNAKEDYNFQTPPMAWDASSPEAHWRNRPDGAPFFSVFNVFSTHESRVWKKSNALCDIDPLEVPIPELLPNGELVRNDVRTNYCNIEQMDWEIGRILEDLKTDGLYDQSMIMFFSDHGGPFPLYKRELSDAGLHVPFIVKWPKDVEGPERNSGMFSFLDLATTALSWLGITPSTILPGKVILPKSSGHEALFGASDRMDEQYDRRRTIRMQNWRLTHNMHPDHIEQISFRESMATNAAIDSAASMGLEPWHSWKNEPRPEWQLYNVDQDATIPVADSMLYANSDVLESLSLILDSAFNETNDFGYFDEAALLDQFHPNGIPDTLTAPEVSVSDGFITVRHDDPDASLGWKYLNDSSGPWNIVSSGKRIEISDSSSSIVEVIAARIGWQHGRSLMEITPHAD
jgi:arylsulfatase A-like enzyme